MLGLENLLRRGHVCEHVVICRWTKAKTREQVCVCARVCVCHRWSEGLVLATKKRGMPAESASSPCDLSAICSGFFGSGSVFFLRRPRLKHVAFFFLCLSHTWWMLIFFYMKYLLVQHCHGRELSCSTKILPSLRKAPLLWTNMDKRFGRRGGCFLTLFSENPKQRGPLYDPLGLLDRSAVPTNTTIFFLCGLSNLSNQAGIADFCLTRDLQKKKDKKPAALNCRLLFVMGVGASQVSPPPPSDIRWPFHASWYYRLFIQPLFKLDADRVALDMCTTTKKKKKKMLTTVILNTFIR